MMNPTTTANTTNSNVDSLNSTTSTSSISAITTQETITESANATTVSSISGGPSNSGTGMGGGSTNDSQSSQPDISATFTHELETELRAILFNTSVHNAQVRPITQVEVRVSFSLITFNELVSIINYICFKIKMTD